MMINLVVGGATGKLGRMVCDIAMQSKDIELIGATVSETGGNIGKQLYDGVITSSPSDLFKLLKDADVYVDVTTPTAASKIISKVPATSTNLILGTTAVDSKALKDLESEVKKNNTSCVVSSNFAKGVNVFWKMCEIMSQYLDDYDIEVIETHHHFKKDAPSGTAMEAVKRMQKTTGIKELTFGREGVTGARGKEIGIHSIRAGDVFGDHTVMFGGNMEVLELKHRSVSREVFAKGCIETVRWIAGKKDGEMHTMDEVYGL